ncbi:MAG: helix-turn-helix domain-containing protein [Treponema sp.]|nr:helix-turn-helix domain-containing protein [Treponema sp.]
MESYGVLLKEARLAQGLDFETISRDTTITRQYLEALEAENESFFPGSPYLVGFLRNYADYLGLNTERVSNLYRAKMLQESPVPEGLIIKHRPKWIVPTIVAGCLLLAGLITFGILLLYRQYINNPEREIALKKTAEPSKYELTDKLLKERLYKGDQLVLGMPTGNIILTVADTSKGALALETPVGKQFVELSEEMEMDVDGDSVPEMIVYVSDVSANETDRGAEVRIMLKSSANSAIAETKTSEIPNAEDLPQSQARTVIFEDNRPYPFTLNVTFRAGCVFRFRPDRKETTEDFFSNGDIVNVTASNMVRLWASNGNTAKIQIIADGKTYDMGVSKAGEVIAEDIRWIKDTDGKYKVVVVQLD